ncbi:MAG: hypothetical protein D3921_15985, partial [Candidatus Electrothrix sp. AW1]|nr:hypothetical protein [Candidatus Electrothrix gigas]
LAGLPSIAVALEVARRDHLVHRSAVYLGDHDFIPGITATCAGPMLPRLYRLYRLLSRYRLYRRYRLHGYRL